MCGTDYRRCVIRAWKNTPLQFDHYYIYRYEDPACSYFKRHHGIKRDLVGSYDHFCGKRNFVYDHLFMDHEESMLLYMVGTFGTESAVR